MDSSRLTTRRSSVDWPSVDIIVCMPSGQVSIPRYGDSATFGGVLQVKRTAKGGPGSRVRSPSSGILGMSGSIESEAQHD